MDQDVRNVLIRQKDVAFATSFEGRPYLRVFQIMKIDGDSIYFATSPKKEVYHQLRQNPDVAFLALDGLVSVRVFGVADFNLTDETRQDIFNSNPVLQNLYKSWSDLAYLRVKVDKIDYFDLSVNPPLMKHYE